MLRNNTSRRRHHHLSSLRTEEWDRLAFISICYTKLCAEQSRAEQEDELFSPLSPFFFGKFFATSLDALCKMRRTVRFPFAPTVSSDGVSETRKRMCL